MRRGVISLGSLGAAAVLGMAVLGAGAAHAAGPLPAAAPTATPPSSPATQSFVGVPSNGVRLSMTAPKQLPLELSADTGKEFREVDVTVSDTGGAGYTGSITVTLTPEGGAQGSTIVAKRFDTASQSWQAVSGSTVTDSVTVPDNGQVVEKLQIDAGINVVSDVRVDASANGATVTGTVPVTEPALTVSGLPAQMRAGVAYPVTATLNNPTDVSFSGVDFVFSLSGCDTRSRVCLKAKDLKLETQSGGTWTPVAMTDDPQQPAAEGVLLTGASLAAGSSLQVPARVTLPQSAPGGVTVFVSFEPRWFTASGSAQNLKATVLAAPTTPSPSSSSSTSTPSASTPSTSDSTSPSPSDSGTGTPATSASTPSPTAASNAAAGTPSAAGGSASATILVAAGLLAVCLALVLWWVLMKRRGRV